MFLAATAEIPYDSIAQFSEAVAAYNNGLALDAQRRGPSAGFKPKTWIQNPVYDFLSAAILAIVSINLHYIMHSEALPAQ